MKILILHEYFTKHLTWILKSLHDADFKSHQQAMMMMIWKDRIFEENQHRF